MNPTHNTYCSTPCVYFGIAAQESGSVVGGRLFDDVVEVPSSYGVVALNAFGGNKWLGRALFMTVLFFGTTTYFVEPLPCCVCCQIK